MRLEAQIRPKGVAAGREFSTLSALDVWGAGRWTRDLAAHVLMAHVDPHPAGSTYRLSTMDTKLHWMCRQYGAALVELAAELGSWDCVGLTLRDVIERTKRLERS